MWAVRHYEPIWTGLDPENRVAELQKVLQGATFLGKTEWLYEAREGDQLEGLGVRPLLLFATRAGWVLGLATREEPGLVTARDGPDWDYPVGREIDRVEVVRAHLALIVGCIDALILVGPAVILRGEEEQQ